MSTTAVQGQTPARAAAPRQREGWPDLAKGLCIVLVVFWHVVTKHVQDIDGADQATIPGIWALLSAQLLPLRMPLFFLVSGLFATRAAFSPDRSTAVRRAGRLVLLYLVWLTIQTFVLLTTPDFDTAHAHSLTDFLLEATINPTNLWYLMALALYTIIGRLTARVPTPVVLIAAFGIAAIAGAGILPGDGNLWQVAQNLFFFLLGLRLRNVVEIFARGATLVTAAICSVAFVGALGAIGVLGARQWFGVWPVACILAVAAGTTICVVFDRGLPRLTAPLRRLGQRTLPIYVIHMMPLALIDLLLRHTVSPDVMMSTVVTVVEPLLLTVVVVAICLWIERGLKAIRLGVLFDPLIAVDAIGRRRADRARKPEPNQDVAQPNPYVYK